MSRAGRAPQQGHPTAPDRHGSARAAAPGWAAAARSPVATMCSSKSRSRPKHRSGRPPLGAESSRSTTATTTRQVAAAKPSLAPTPAAKPKKTRGGHEHGFREGKPDPPVRDRSDSAQPRPQRPGGRWTVRCRIRGATRGSAATVGWVLRPDDVASKSLVRACGCRLGTVDQVSVASECRCDPSPGPVPAGRGRICAGRSALGRPTDGIDGLDLRGQRRSGGRPASSARSGEYALPVRVGAAGQAAFDLTIRLA